MILFDKNQKTGHSAEIAEESVEKQWREDLFPGIKLDFWQKIKNIFKQIVS